MADISLIDPYSAQQESIAQRRRMAQALQQQAQAPLEMPQTPGVLISPYAGLAKILQGVIGGYQQAEAAKEYKALGEEARTNQAADFAKVIGALKAPGQEAIEGQDAVDFVPGSYTPERTSLRNYVETTIPAEFTPTIPGRPAIAAQPAREAGYIGPDLIASLKDPSMRQFAMAQAMAKLEPKAPISLPAGGTLLDPRTYQPLATGKAAPQRGVALSPGQQLFDSTTGAVLATAAAKTETAALSPLGKLQSERAAIFATDPKDARLPAYDKAILKESEDQNLAFNREKFEWEKGNQGLKLEKITNDLGEEMLMAVNSAGIARPVRTGTGEIVKSAAPIKMIRVETEAADGSIKMVLMSEKDQKLKDGIALRGPEYVSITTVNAQGMPEIRQVKKDDEILKTGYVKPLEGFLGQLQAAGVSMDKIRSDPKIRDLVDRYFVKTAGGVAPEDVAGFDLRKAEVVARLRELGIAIPANITGLGLSATPGVLGGTQPASAAAPAPTSAALPLPADRDKNKLVNGQTYQTNNGLAKWNAALGQFVPVP